MGNLERAVERIKLEKDMCNVIRDKIHAMREKYIDTQVVNDIDKAEVNGMIQMLSLVTGRKYFYSLKGLREL